MSFGNCWNICIIAVDGTWGEVTTAMATHDCISILPGVDGAVLHSWGSTAFHLYTRLSIAVDVAVGEGATALFKHNHTSTLSVMNGAVLHSWVSSA